MAKEATDFKAIFERLRAILAPYAPSMTVTADAPGNYYLDTRVIAANGKPIFFGAATVQKNYVSFYLMPVYMFPEMLDNVSPELKKRKTGKSCFNFKSLTDENVAELSRLVKEGADRFKSEGAKLGARS